MKPTEFDPKAMLAPGIAGSVTMTVTNALAVSFGYEPPVVALLVSFVFGLLVFVSPVSMLQRMVLYVPVSLTIFAAAVGTQTVAPMLAAPEVVARAEAVQPSPTPQPTPASPPRQFLDPWFQQKGR